MRKSIEWYRTHDPMTQIKLKDVLDKDVEQFINEPISVLVITLKELGQMYDVSGSDFGDQVLKELVRLISCFFDENYIYRDGYNSFIVLDVSKDFQSHLARLQENVAHYKIHQYLVYTTLQFGVASAILTNPSMIYDLIGKARLSIGTNKQEKLLQSPLTLNDQEKDEATGLLTIEAFGSRASQLLETIDLVTDPTLICFFDIAHFHRFNKRYGYEAGNRMLKDVVSLIQKYFPARLIGHLSADRFVVFTREEGIEDLVHQINVTFDEKYFDKEVWIYTGIYRIRERTRIATAIDRARLAASTLMEEPSVRLCYFDEETRNQLLFESYVIEHLEEALKNGDIELYYQPIYRTLTRKVAGVEASVRWHNVRGKTLMPHEFVPILEKHHMIHILDLHVMKQVCKDYAEFKYQGGVMEPFSLNISAHDFELCDLVELLNKETALYEIPRNHVRLELNSLKLIERDPYIVEELERLKYLGYEIWLDNCGAFLSAFQMIQNQPFDAYKLSAEYFPKFDETTKTVMKAQVLTAKRLGIRCVVKGITNQPFEDFVSDLGVDYLQGDLLNTYEPYSRRHARFTNDVFETPEDYHYQEMISDQRMYEEDDLAICIVEVERFYKKIIVMNGPFKATLKNLHIKDVESLENLMNHKPQIFMKNMRMIVNSSKKNHDLQSFNIAIGSFVVAAQLQYIAETSTKEAFLVRILHVDIAKKQESSEVLDYLFDRYEQIYLVTPTLNKAVPILRSSAVNDEINDLHQLIELFIEKQLYRHDEERYREFVSTKTLLSRIYSSPLQTLEGHFRIREEDGGYRMKRIIISLAREGANPLLLYTVASMALASFKKPTVTNSDFQYGVLFDNVINQLKLGFFWKDRERRFVGANNTFLKYFGFASEADIIGKTDEEMGWHVSPDRFKKDEEEVINEGLHKVDVEGNCLVEGALRKIRVFKIPIYVQGEIIGLLGCFEDITDRSVIVKNFLNYQDEVTDCANKTGLAIGLEQYIREYNISHTDFCYMCFSIDNLRSMINDEGIDRVNLILKEMAKRIKAIVHNQGLLAYIYGDLFVILTQVCKQDEIQMLMNQMIENIRDVQIPDSRMTPYVTGAYALYSEAKETYAIDDLVLKRLAKNKEEMKKRRIAYFQAHSVGRYKELIKGYLPIFTHIVVMNEKMEILYSEHMISEVHNYLIDPESGLSAKCRLHHNTYSGIERIHGESYYCVTKWEELSGQGYLVELAKKVEM